MLAGQQCGKARCKGFITKTISIVCEPEIIMSALYHEWRAEDGMSTIITNDEAARNDYNLSPSRYVSTNGKEEVLPLEEAVVRLLEAEEDRAEADRALNEVLRTLGVL